jgi:hypothetical protein
MILFAIHAAAPDSLQGQWQAGSLDFGFGGIDLSKEQSSIAMALY